VEPDQKDGLIERCGQTRESSPQPASRSHNHATRILLLRLLVEHLTLSTQAIRLSDQTVDLLASFQHALDRLMQHDLGLIQLPLHLHDTVRLVRILVFLNVLFQLRIRPRRDGRRRVRRPGILRREFIHDLRKKLVCHQGGILGVRDYDACDALAGAIGVECVCSLFDVLSHPWLGPLRYRFGEHGHEFAVAVGARNVRSFGRVCLGMG